MLIVLLPLAKISLSRPVWGAWIEILALCCAFPQPPSRPVWGAWIEIRLQTAWNTTRYGRAPYGARGLKCLVSGFCKNHGGRAPYGARGLKLKKPKAMQGTGTSRPVWGAWIEIHERCHAAVILLRRSRPVWGAWIEILTAYNKSVIIVCRAPYGARGLKYTTDDIAQNVNGSRAPYGARGLKCYKLSRKEGRK